MNLMEESFVDNGQKKKNRTSTFILIAIFIVLLVIIFIIIYLGSIKNEQMKIYLDGKNTEKIKETLLIEDDGTIYAQIRGIAGYLGYDSYNGEYSEKSEERNKCYIESQTKDEVANFELGSNKIYKLDLTKDNKNKNYEYIYTEKSVKSNNGELYATVEAIEKAFNVSFDYDKNNNTITIYTMPYLIKTYSAKALDYGYKEVSDVLSNKKAIFESMLIVKKDDKTTGVINVTDGKLVLEAKYDNITYLPSIGDFIVEADKKMGIISANGRTKIRLVYDSIELMDQDAKLYLVQRDNKVGAIDFNGNIKIDISNDEIGMDISKFDRNEIKNKYILAENIIPVKQNNLWALFDKNGNKLVDYLYDSLGYVASSNKNMYSLLVIPDYNVLVACKNKKYTLINSYGKQLFAAPVADDIYMTIEGNKKQYKINANNNLYDAIEFLESLGINAKEKQKNEENTTNKSGNTTQNQDNNQLNNNANEYIQENQNEE